ncbi:MAG: hypothetical protein LBL81_00765, partial [Tannerella sp.]|nr:hypothetical protein [Tannerella sp.]
SGIFLLIIVGVSLLSVVAKISRTIFFNQAGDLKPPHFSISGVRYMFILQYAMVMFIAIMAIGITRQMRLVSGTQIGGKDILVINALPEEAQTKYGLLKEELLKHAEVASVTSAMQLPGKAIRDGALFRCEGQAQENVQFMQVLAVGNDFIPFFDLHLAAGYPFSNVSRTRADEKAMLLDYWDNDYAPSGLSETYIINSRAMHTLGFTRPEETIGKRLILSRGSGVAYIDKGTIVGVLGDDFNYTSAYEENIPLVLMVRKYFQHCLFVRFKGNKEQGVAAFKQAWHTVIPNIHADYSFLSDVYANVYHNERMAKSLVNFFALLSLIVANLGLVIIMAFLIKRKTKEIGIRKVNGASATNILCLLNGRIAVWICIAFIVAIPPAWWAFKVWLENFARKTPLHWWIFVLAGLSVMLVSTLAVSLQTFRALRLNPVVALKTE